MRVLALVLLIVSGLALPAAAETVAPGTFTRQFAAALQKALPKAKIRITRELGFEIDRADGTSAAINLANLYKDYLAEPARFDEFVKAYAAALAKSPASRSAALDRTQIVPVIKDRQALTGLQALFRKQSKTQQPLFDELNPELVVVYAEDTPQRVRYLSSSEETGVPRTALRALAVENVMRLMPPIELRQLAEGSYMMTSHAEYGASLLLADSIWSGGQIKVSGDYVVAVPAKDVILITGSGSPDEVSKMRQLALKLSQGRYGLTATLFVRRRGEIVRFDAP